MMRRNEFIGLLASSLCVAGCRGIGDVQKTTQSFKIMSWNIRAGLGMDKVRDISRAAKVIKAFGADVVALQEVDRNTKRSGGIDQLKELEKETGLVGTWCKAIDHQGGEYGIALLSRLAPVSVRRIKLPLLGKNEQRMLLVAEFEEFAIGVTHLSLLPEERMASLELLREFATTEKPFFLAGDWNARPESEFVKEVCKSYTILSGSEYTFPAPNPNRCIDYIAVSNRTRCEKMECKVLPEPVVSDHRPVVVCLGVEQRL